MSSLEGTTEPQDGDPADVAVAESIATDNASELGEDENPNEEDATEESSEEEEDPGPTAEEEAAANLREQKRRAALASRSHGISGLNFDLTSLMGVKLEVKTPTLANSLAQILERLAAVEAGQEKIISDNDSRVRTLIITTAQ